jgi:hypothetical protein
MERHDCHVLVAPPEMKAALQSASESYSVSIDYMSALSRKALMAVGDNLGSVFAVNVTRSWSLGRLAAVVRTVRRDAIVACAFIPTSRLSAIDQQDAGRWFARTPGAMVPAEADPWGSAIAHRRAELPPSIATPATGRNLVRTTLTEWGRDDVADDAALVASEMLTNSIEHSASLVIGIDVACSDRHVYVGVEDDAIYSFPIFRRPSHGTHAGRGLRIVAAYSMWWGVTTYPTRKVVWAELAPD